MWNSIVSLPFRLFSFLIEDYHFFVETIEKICTVVCSGHAYICIFLYYKYFERTTYYSEPSDYYIVRTDDYIIRTDFYIVRTIYHIVPTDY